jgi:hypothetical protein
MFNFARMIQALMVFGAEVVTTEMTKTPEPKILVEMPDADTETVYASLYRKDMENVIKNGLPAGSMVTPVQKFIPEHAEANHQVIASTSATQTRLANTPDTLAMLKRRLAKELYRMEMDLQNGGRIPTKAGGAVSCDCLGQKHSLGIEATAEELMSYDKNPVYGKVISWMNTHAPVFDPAEIEKRPPEYYQQLTPEVRSFRKEVLGTEKMT